MKVEMKFHIFLVLPFCLLLTAPIRADDEAATTAASPENVASETIHEVNADVNVTEGDVSPTPEGLHESKADTPQHEEHHEGNEAPHDLKTDEGKEKPVVVDGEVKVKAEEKDSTEGQAKDKPVESEAEDKTEGHNKDKPAEEIKTVAADSASADMHEHLAQEKEKTAINQTEEKPNETQPQDEKQFMKTLRMTATFDDKLGETTDATIPSDKKAAEEKAAAQVNEEPQEVNFAFPTNNPNNEDEFEKMARRMTTNKDLDEALAKKIGSDWMEHGDHNNETDQPNFVFNTAESTTGENSVSFKIQPEIELTPVEDKKNAKTGDTKTNEDKYVRSALPETNTGAEKDPEPSKDDKETKKAKVQTTNDTKPKESKFIDESEESAEEKSTSNGTNKPKTNQGNGVLDSKEATDSSKEESNGVNQIQNESEAPIGKKKKQQTDKKLSVEKQPPSAAKTQDDILQQVPKDTVQENTQTIKKDELKKADSAEENTQPINKEELKKLDSVQENTHPIKKEKAKEPDSAQEDTKPMKKELEKPDSVQENTQPIKKPDSVQGSVPIKKGEAKKPKTSENKIQLKKKNPKAPEVKPEGKSSNEVQLSSKETAKAHIPDSKPKEIGKRPTVETKLKELPNNKKPKPIAKQPKTDDKSDALPDALTEDEIMKEAVKFEKQPGAKETPRELELKTLKSTDGKGKSTSKLGKGDDKSAKSQTEEELMKNAMQFEKPNKADSTSDPRAPKLSAVEPKNAAQGNQNKTENDGTNVNTTLVFVEVVFRHGDRYKGLVKDETYPLDPYAVEDPFWLPYGCDQLRNKGKMRGFWLGQFMRKRYNGFLKDEYYHHDIRVTSADLDRCIDSAQVMTVGLYPPKGINIWNDNVGRFYQPVPVRTLDPEDDIFLNEEITCIPYEKELDNILFEGMRNFNAKYRYVYEYLEMYTGMPVTTLEDVAQIYTTLRIENENGRKLPDWVNLVFPEKMKMLNSYYNQIRASTDYFKTIQAGPLLTLLMDEMKLKSTNRLQPNYKIKFWSGFDTTILKLMYTMKETQPSLEAAEELLETDYNGALLIEMHLINKKHYVKALYVNMDSLFAKTKAPRPVKICNGVYLCPLEQFLERMSKYKIYKEDWFKMCNLTYCSNNLVEKYNMQYLRR
uniref:acid phosphatase n=1 Tax=Cacopsylla melanoneura TaxID=428564 RepID=A0A8D9FIW0_9HEMI